MKQFLALGFLATVAFFGLTQDSQANGGMFRRCRGGCDSGCASAPCAPAAPVEVKWEERKVKVAKQVMKEKEIDVLECRRVMKDVPYTYTVCVPVTKQEKRIVNICTPTTREVDTTWTVMTPKTVEKKVQCTTYTCERVNITEKVPVCRVVCVTYVDECGRCCTKRERVTEWCEQTRCVIKRTPVVTEKTVLVTICEPVIHKGKKTICEYVNTPKEVMVNVCTYNHEKREGVRQVCETVTEKVKRKVQYCETVWEEQTIRVQVGGACASDCGSDCGHGRGHRGGIFRRGGGCCN